MRRFVSFFCLFLLVSVSLSAQDSSYARRIIAGLTDSSMWGRGYSYGGDARAAEFIRAEFRNLGVEPLGDDYFQYYPLDVYGFEGNCELYINGEALVPYEQFRVVPAYSAKRRMEASWSRTVDGVAIVGVEKLSTMVPVTGGKTTTPVSIEVLQSALPKKVKKVKFQLPIQHYPQYRTQNVCGMVRGETDTMLVFTAHYDHCGTMGDNVLFPGAHDNASGVAAVLDMARMATLQKPHYTMVFMLFSGEETGLCGSLYAATHPLVDFSKVRLLTNIDMFCGGDEGFMVVNANDSLTSPFVKVMEEESAQMEHPVVVKRRNNAANSDHYWFSQLCPAIFIYTLGGPYGGYHDPADTCEGCGLRNYQDILSVIRQVLMR